MYNWENKVFRDNVHGYIKIPKLFVEKLIDTDLFQRLRYIEQTGMRTLYPSARHDRFIHSLGTYHLGVKAYEAFRENVRLYYSTQTRAERNHYYILNDKDENEAFWDKYGVLFSIACLLHDCGHAPFSHTLEFMFDLQKLKDGSDTSVLNNELLKAYPSDIFKSDFTIKGIGKEHERMSALLVKVAYESAIREIIEKFDVWSIEDLEFIARAIIGCKYKNTESKANQIKNCFIQLLNSKSIDVDGLDYITRDSRLSGVNNVTVDADRLINSLTIIEKTHYNGQALDDYYIDAILTNGKLVQGKVNARLSGSIQANNFCGLIKGQIFIKGTAKILETVKENEISIKKFIKIGGTEVNSIPSTPNIVDIEINATMTQALNLQSAQLMSYEEMNADFETNNKSDFIMPSVYLKGKISGVFSGEVLGYHEEGAKVEIVLAFHKNSLSVLQNVISARNYEYLWIYGHHKVAYYSNYLLIHILHQTIKFMTSYDRNKRTDEILHNSLSMLEPYTFKDITFFRANDSDLISLFKQYCFINKKRKRVDLKLDQLCTELFTRNYKKSVWKSYAEYNLFFKDLSDDEKMGLFSVILDNTTSSANINLYGYFKSEWNKKFEEFGMNDVVWVNAEVKMKDLEPDETFILLKDKPLRLRDVAITENLNKKPNIRLFYLYYSSEKAMTRERLDNLIEFLKESAIKKSRS